MLLSKQPQGMSLWKCITKYLTFCFFTFQHLRFMPTTVYIYPIDVSISDSFLISFFFFFFFFCFSYFSTNVYFEKWDFFFFFLLMRSSGYSVNGTLTIKLYLLPHTTEPEVRFFIPIWAWNHLFQQHVCPAETLNHSPTHPRPPPRNHQWTLNNSTPIIRVPILLTASALNYEMVIFYLFIYLFLFIYFFFYIYLFIYLFIFFCLVLCLNMLDERQRVHLPWS